MKNLEFFYENPPIIDKFIDRKAKISKPKTIIKGAANSGKSYLMFGNLNEFKHNEFLYLNLQDFRLEFNTSNLEKFLQKNPKIKMLAIDNLTMENSDFLNLLPKLNLENILITSIQNSLNINDFDELNLKGLDFEEYLKFANKNGDLGNIFSEFLRRGNGLTKSYHRVDFLQKNLKSHYDKTELLILIESAKFNSSSFSSNKIYTNLKQKFKISKDSVYKTIEKFEDENLIKFVPKFDANIKKLYFSDFSFCDGLNYKKDFHKKLVNTFYCELLKIDEKIYFTNDLDFYIPKKNSAFLIMPFMPVEFIFLKFKKILPNLKKLDIKEIYVITMGNEGFLKLDNIECLVMPFWQYVLSL